MGFDVLEGKQIDDDYHMFDSLNFPAGHPARDMYDTFRTDEGYVLPAHTSAMQNRAYKLYGPPPIMTILPGRCFRMKQQMQVMNIPSIKSKVFL